MLYPLKLNPIYKPRLWGSRRLVGLFNLTLPPHQNIGELWAIADHGQDSNQIANGPLAGHTIGQIRETYPVELMGQHSNPKHFPLLVKVLDAYQKLSVQVHPDDSFAACHENDVGKNEFWYVIAAQPGAEIVYGLRPGVTSAQLDRAVRQHTLDSLLNRVTVHAGDTFYIPAGLVHALGAGIIVAEIQQNSDLTYRLYDYNRVDSNGRSRELHVQKGVAATKCDLHPSKAELSTPFNAPNFNVSLFRARGYNHIANPESKMWVWFVLLGAGQISGAGEVVALKSGDALLVPASLRDVKLHGFMSILRSSPH